MFNTAIITAFLTRFTDMYHLGHDPAFLSGMLPCTTAFTLVLGITIIALFRSIFFKSPRWSSVLVLVIGICSIVLHHSLSLVLASYGISFAPTAKEAMTLIGFFIFVVFWLANVPTAVGAPTTRMTDAHLQGRQRRAAARRAVCPVGKLTTSHLPHKGSLGRDKAYEKNTTIAQKDAIICDHQKTIAAQLEESVAVSHVLEDQDTLIAQLKAKIASLEAEASNRKMEVQRIKHAHINEVHANSELKATNKRLENTVSRQTGELAHKVRMIESRNDHIAELQAAFAMNASVVATHTVDNLELAALNEWNDLLAEHGLISTSDDSWEDRWLCDGQIGFSLEGSEELADAETTFRLTDTLTPTTDVLEPIVQQSSAASEQTTQARMAQLRMDADAELQAMMDSVVLAPAFQTDLGDDDLKELQRELAAFCATPPRRRAPANSSHLRDAANAELDDMADDLGSLALQTDLGDDDLQAMRLECMAFCVTPPRPRAQPRPAQLRDAADKELQNMVDNLGSCALETDLGDDDLKALQLECAAFCITPPRPRLQTRSSELRDAADAELQDMADSLGTVALQTDLGDEDLMAIQLELAAACTPPRTRAPRPTVPSSAIPSQRARPPPSTAPAKPSKTTSLPTAAAKSKSMRTSSTRTPASSAPRRQPQTRSKPSASKKENRPPVTKAASASAKTSAGGPSRKRPGVSTLSRRPLSALPPPKSR